MKLINLFLAAATAACSAVTIPAATVSVEAGNVVFVGASGQRRQLTATGLDSEAVLSPDGRIVAFVRETPDFPIEAGVGEQTANEIWLVDVEGKTPRRLLRGKASADMKNVLAGFSSLVFGLDSQRLYFLGAAWVTSNAVCAVDCATGKVEFVAAGNSLELVREGKHAGSLIVQQHRYFLGAGSYDWYWLLDPAGKEIGPIGEEEGLAAFRELNAAPPP